MFEALVFKNYFTRYFYCLCLWGTKSKKLRRILIFLIWFGEVFGVTLLKVLCFWSFLYKVIGNFSSYSGYKTCSNKNSFIRNAHKYIFLKLFNILHSKNSNYTIYHIYYRHDLSLSMRVWKENKKKKTMREKTREIIRNN